MAYIGYARVSTDDQHMHLQVDALTAAGCLRIFQEEVSGGASDKPELRKALDCLRDGEDALVVWKLDRLARSLKQLITLVEGLKARRIGFRSLTEDLNTTTAGGMLILHVFGAMAEFERAIIRERTVAGLRAAKLRGKTGGRKAKLSEDDKELARVIMRQLQPNVSALARRLHVHRATIYRAIHEEAQPHRAAAD